MTARPVYVETDDVLREAAAWLSDSHIVAVDTESDSMYAYREKVCFVQLRAKEKTFIVDTLALRDLSPLAPVFAADEIVKVVHGGDYDVVCLRRDFDLSFSNLFDTMIAAQFLDKEAVGLAALCKSYFDAELDKSLTRHNWSLRPLEPQYLQYMEDDVLYLHGLREALLGELEEKDVREEAELEFDRLTTLEWTGKAFDPEGYWRVKGVGDLDDQGQAVLKCLWAARDEMSKEVDLPPTRFIHNNLLLHFARTRPKDLAELQKMRRLSRKLVDRFAPRIVEAVNEGRSGNVTVGRPPRRKARVPRQEQQLDDALRTFRKKEATKRGVMNGVVFPNHCLAAMIERKPSTLDELERIPYFGKKRCTRYGAAILEIIDRG